MNSLKMKLLNHRDLETYNYVLSFAKNNHLLNLVLNFYSH